jgi:hypothetical protein
MKIQLSPDEVRMVADLLESEWDIRSQIAETDAESERDWHIGRARMAANLYERLTGDKSEWLEDERRQLALDAFEHSLLTLTVDAP